MIKTLATKAKLKAGQDKIVKRLIQVISVGKEAILNMREPNIV